MRLRYATGNKQEKTILTPAILDLEKRILQMSGELDALEINVRNAEKQNNNNSELWIYLLSPFSLSPQ